MPNIIDLVENSGAIKRGKFKLSNGKLTDYYIDKYAFETDPAILSKIATAISEQILGEDIDVIAGPELGAIPLVTAMSLECNIDAAYVRKGKKHQGTQARIEGSIGKGDRAVIIEDVSTTGGTILEAAKLVEEAGGFVEQLIVVVDRNEGAVENVREQGYELEYLVQIGEDYDVVSPE